MRLVARIYITAILALGGAALVSGLLAWQPQNPLRLCLYVAAAMLCSGLKVRLPGVQGTMSVSYVIVLLGVAELGLAETLLVGMGATLVQSFWRAKRRPATIQVLFNHAAIAIAISGAYSVQHVSWPPLARLHPTLLLILTAGAYFFLNTVSMALVLALTEGKRLLAVWKECYFWSLPYYLLGASIAGALIYVTRQFGWEVSVLVLPAVYLIYRSYRLYLGRLEKEKEHAEQMAALHLRTIEALALAIEAKDDVTHNHLNRVQVYTAAVGKEFGLSPDEFQALQAAAILHDIGKLAVPDYIVSKPGKLTAEEFEKLKIHPVVGAEILARVRFPYPVVPIVRGHHEKWDGSGYPDGLAGEKIPVGARILAAVDCLDALTSDRQYRPAFPLEEAMAIVVSESGRSYDPRVVEILKRRGAELEAKARAQSQAAPANNFSKDLRVERGEAPAAGLELPVTPERFTEELASLDFVNRIAAARQEVQALYELTLELGSSLSLHETLSVLGMRLKKLIPHDCIAIYLRRDHLLKPEFVSGEDSALFSALEIPVGHGLSGWVAEQGRPVVNGNPSVESGYLSEPRKFSTLGSALAVPLAGPEGVFAVLTLYRREKGGFANDHLRLLQAVQGKLALAVENALRYRQVERFAVTDGLTGLPNARSLFLRLDAELSRSKRSAEPLAVVVGDLDGFKRVNDTFGHMEGNRVLQYVAQRLRELCREYDIVARMGGDEFVLVFPGLAPEAAAAKMSSVCRSVAEGARRTFPAEDIVLSAGYATFPGDGQDAEELLAVADRRMFAVKRDRRSLGGLLAAVEEPDQILADARR